MGYRDALLSVSLKNDKGDTHDVTAVGSIFEVMHVCASLGLEPDPELGEGGVIFVHSDTGSWGSVRPVDRARDMIDHFMELQAKGGDCGHDH
jgi:hypothetical protein